MFGVPSRIISCVSAWAKNESDDAESVGRCLRCVVCCVEMLIWAPPVRAPSNRRGACWEQQRLVWCVFDKSKVQRTLNDSLVWACELRMSKMMLKTRVAVCVGWRQRAMSSERRLPRDRHDGLKCRYDDLIGGTMAW